MPLLANPLPDITKTWMILTAALVVSLYKQSNLFFSTALSTV